MAAANLHAAPIETKDENPNAEAAIALGIQMSQWVDKVLLDYAGLRDINDWARVIFSIINYVPWVDLRTIEEKFRRLNIEVYLVGEPLEDPENFCSKLLWDPPEHFRAFTVWIGINGRAEALAKINELGITGAQNLNRLMHTGVRMPRPAIN